MSEVEVTNEIVLSILAGCEARGLDRDALLDGLGFDAESLKQRWRRSAWGDFAALVERIQSALGGPDQLDEFAAGLITENRIMRLLGRLVLEPRHLYLIGAERIARRMYPGAGGRIYPLSSGRIGYEAVIPQTCRPALPVWYALRGALRGIPVLVGLQPATVDAQMSGHQARYVITPPAARTVASRAADAFAAPLRKLLDGFRPDQEPTAGDMVDMLQLAFSDASGADIASDIGPRLAAHSDVSTFTADVVGVMKQLFCCSHVALWCYGVTGEQTLLHREPGPPTGDRVTRVLHIEGRPVGRIELDVQGLDAPSSPTLDALLPWIALGLRWTCTEEARSHTSAPADRLRTFGERWQLTPRQQQVLALLVNGLSNREIANALQTSVKNIEIHVTNLLSRVGVDNRAKLITRFWQN